MRRGYQCNGAGLCNKAILDESLPAAHPTAQHDPLSVFVADDNEIDLEGLVRMCQAFGWRTTAVPSGNDLLQRLEALKDTRQKLPDALVVDWKMPGLDGIQTLNALAERWGPKAVLGQGCRAAS